MNQDLFLNEFAVKKVFSVFYLAPLQNLASITINGILSHNEISRKGIYHRDVSDPGAQGLRKSKDIRVTRLVDNSILISALHELVPLYFSSSNAMLFKLIGERTAVCIIELSLERLFDSIETLAFSDGNLAANNSTAYRDIKHVATLPWNDIQRGSWDHSDAEIKKERKRKICAELLVSPAVQPTSIVNVWVAGPESEAFAHEQLRAAGTTVDKIEQSNDRFFGKSSKVEQAVHRLDNSDSRSLATASSPECWTGSSYSRTGECKCSPGLNQPIKLPCAYCEKVVLRNH